MYILYDNVKKECIKDLAELPTSVGLDSNLEYLEKEDSAYPEFDTDLEKVIPLPSKKVGDKWVRSYKVEAKAAEDVKKTKCDKIKGKFEVERDKNREALSGKTSIYMVRKVISLLNKARKDIELSSEEEKFLDLMDGAQNKFGDLEKNRDKLLEDVENEIDFDLEAGW